MKGLLLLAVLSGVGCSHAQEPGLLARVGQAKLPAPGLGNVQLAVEPADAEVVVDGVTQGLASDFDGTHGRLELREGPHRLEVKRPGYRTFAATVYATPEGRQRIQVSLEKE